MQRLTLESIQQQLESDGYYLVEELGWNLVYQRPKGGPSGTITVFVDSKQAESNAMVKRIRFGRHEPD